MITIIFTNTIFVLGVIEFSNKSKSISQSPFFNLSEISFILPFFNKTDDLINIGYPGTKFVLGSDLILNLSPDMPKNLDGYENFIQLVIMDGADLRERAASTWSKCKDLGLKTKFVESI